MRSFVPCTASLVLLAALPAAAQAQQLWESPAASLSQNLGLTKISVSYHRPAVKGRAIWGGLVPYGEVWRTGANEATTISFSTAVKVAGHDVPAGTYAFFAIPGKDSWTLILNKEAEQWGSFFYKADKDQLRFEVKPEAAPMQEWLDYGLDLAGPDTAVLGLRWEKLKVAFPISADVKGLYEAHLADEVKKADASADPKRLGTYLLAAKYWIQRGEKLPEAGALLDKADAVKSTFWSEEWRARLLQKQGRVKEALPYLDKAMADAPAAGAPKEYVEGLVKLKAEWQGAKP